MEPVRVLAQPVVKLVLSFGADGVTDLTAEGVEMNQTQRLRIESGRQWRAMPSPLRHRTERRLLFINFRKGLQSRHVSSEREFPVADRQRGQRIDLSQHRVVAMNEGRAINLRAPC